jgi:hypothetical protein
LAAAPRVRALPAEKGDDELEGFGGIGRCAGHRMRREQDSNQEQKKLSHGSSI